MQLRPAPSVNTEEQLARWGTNGTAAVFIMSPGTPNDLQCWRFPDSSTLLTGILKTLWRVLWRICLLKNTSKLLIHTFPLTLFHFLLEQTVTSSLWTSNVHLKKLFKSHQNKTSFCLLYYDYCWILIPTHGMILITKSNHFHAKVGSHLFPKELLT